MTEYRIIDARDVADTAWMDAPDRGCAGTATSTFFPGRGQSQEEPRSKCDACPYTQRCLDYALAWRIEFGVWGGTSERMRRNLYRHKKVRRICALPGCGSHFLTGSLNKQDFCSQDCRQKHYLLYQRQHREEWGEEEAS